MHKQSANVLDLTDIMARNFEEFCGSSLNEAWYFDPDLSLVQGDDFYDSVSPSENIWKKFELLPTPPLSPSREEDDSYLDEIDYSYLIPTVPLTAEEEWLSAAICFDNTTGLKSKLIQDCMWSGSDEEQARVSRNRKYSLSEVNMVSASVSSVDPTAVTSIPPAPKAQNQVEHSYSLTGPEPPRVPMLPTPTATDDSESEEDVDVVTVDTRTTSTHCSPRYSTKIITTPSQIRHDLKAVAAKLTSNSLKRPRLDYEFSVPSAKKMKKYSSSSLLSSVSSSDSEEFEGKRSIHNVMERQRRNELKLSLHSLRDILPSLETQEKAPKVVILAHATRYVSELKAQDVELVCELKELKQQNQYLRNRLDDLESRLKLSL